MPKMIPEDWEHVRHFQPHEFACKCGCGAGDVEKDLIVRLDMGRSIYGRPMVINSGARCPKHNAEIGSVPDSSHINDKTRIGKAADIKHWNPNLRNKVKDMRAKGWSASAILNAISMMDDDESLLARVLIGQGFTRLGIARSFVHVDVDHGKPDPAVWIYA